MDPILLCQRKKMILKNMIKKKRQLKLLMTQMTTLQLLNQWQKKQKINVLTKLR